MGKPVFVSGLKVPPAGCWGSQPGWSGGFKGGSPGAWVRPRLGQGGVLWAHCTLPSGAAVVTAPRSRQEARGPGELITVPHLPSCPCGLCPVCCHPHLLGPLPCRASPAPPRFLRGTGVPCLSCTPAPRPPHSLGMLSLRSRCIMPSTHMPAPPGSPLPLVLGMAWGRWARGLMPGRPEFDSGWVSYRHVTLNRSHSLVSVNLSFPVPRGVGGLKEPTGRGVSSW